MRKKKSIYLPVLLLLLTGCESAQDKAFIADCQSKRGFTEAQCSCVNDLINDGLEETGQLYVKAIVVGDQSKAAQIQSGFGIFEGTQILSRAAWLAANSNNACGVSI